MSRWEFLELNREGERVPFQDTKIVHALESSLHSAIRSEVPNPKFSKYYVNCACLLISKRTGSVSTISRYSYGGNLEYGLCQALHGEESLVAGMSAMRGTSCIDPNQFDVIVAFSSKFDTGKVPTCCGNCRDIMRDYFPPETMIFSGHPEGGKVIIARLSNLLTDTYWSSHPSFVIMDMIKTTISRGLLLENNIYFSGMPHPRRKYCASIVGERTVFFGAHDVMCDYHPIYAIRDAVRQARRENKPCFNYVIVATKDDGTDMPPDVMYKDRQHLLELNFQQECLIGRECDPPVFLATFYQTNEQPVIRGIWGTSVKKWLPYPFSPAAFGDDFIKHATAQFKKK